MSQSESVIIDRSRINLKPNVIVGFEGKPYKIINILNDSDVVISSLESAKCLQVNAKALSVFDSGNEESATLNKGDHDISAEAWNVAISRFEAIKPLIEYSTNELVLQRAKAYNVHEVTFWKWLKAYRSHNSILALIPKKRGWSQDKSRMSPLVTNIVNKAIQEDYLNSKKPIISKVIETVMAECHHLKIEPPHENSIRRRIQALNDYDVVKARLGKKAANDRFGASAGSFPNADYPLAYVQIDHTPYTIHHTPYTIHHTPYTIHHTPYTIRH